MTWAAPSVETVLQMLSAFCSGLALGGVSLYLWMRRLRKK